MDFAAETVLCSVFFAADIVLSFAMETCCRALLLTEWSELPDDDAETEALPLTSVFTDVELLFETS